MGKGHRARVCDRVVYTRPRIFSSFPSLPPSPSPRVIIRRIRGDRRVTCHEHSCLRRCISSCATPRASIMFVRGAPFLLIRPSRIPPANSENLDNRFNNKTVIIITTNAGSIPSYFPKLFGRKPPGLPARAPNYVPSRPVSNCLFIGYFFFLLLRIYTICLNSYNKHNRRCFFFAKRNGSP